ncbi:hypothetical protein VTJ83DRAFT_7120 [Remersonia thermophila]|uniref:Heterokaryon incompatibility domain-containing protein n=1 Tax=Remersonia thermophila TaxID=72144 RepID=A0ABR4D2L1_9PEZI
MRRRAVSEPSPVPRWPLYTYTPLPSPRHIRLLEIVSYDAIRGLVYVTLTEHPIESVADRFTALSYTWSDPVEPFFLKLGPDRSTPTTDPATPSPDTIELIVLPPEAHGTFRRRDDLAPETETHPVADTSTALDVARLPLARRSNLSDFFRAYLLDFPARHTRPRPLPDGGSHRYTHEQVAHLWIDALCIDQSNSTQEKATQIPLMGEIYSRAARVVSWLGGDTWMLDLDKRRVDGKILLGIGDFLSAEFWRDVIGLQEDPPGPDSVDPWLAVWFDVFIVYRTRRYFRRAWIVQEMALAKKVDVMIGRHGKELDFGDMLDLALFLESNRVYDHIKSAIEQTADPVHVQDMTNGFWTSDIRQLREIIHGFQPMRLREPIGLDREGCLLAALLAVRQRDCLYPQDKVHAVRGILGRLSDMGHAGLDVDAAATPREVYLKLAAAYLEADLPLTVLSLLDHPDYRNLADLPSWVPDFSTKEFPEPLRLRAFAACVLAPLHASTRPRSIGPAGELRLRGFRLDRMAMVPGREGGLGGRLGEAVVAILASMPTLYPPSRALGSQDAAASRRDTGITPSGEHCLHVVLSMFHVLAKVLVYRMDMAYSHLCEWLHFELVVAYAQGQTDAAKRDRWDGIEASMNALAAQAEEDDAIACIMPRLEDVREHGEVLAMSMAALPSTDPGNPRYPAAILDILPAGPYAQLDGAFHLRTLFRTANGWVGACMSACKPGDEAAVLPGGDPEGRGPPRYRFCGECYVPGVMNGELVRGRAAEVAEQLRDIILV